MNDGSDNLLFIDKVVGFIGGGNMAKAIGLGLLRKGVIKPNQLYVSAPSHHTLDTWKTHDVHVTHDNAEVILKSDVIFLAFKPYQLDTALEHINLKNLDSKLFISILVGVSCDVIIAKLQSNVQSNVRLVRTMPNVAVVTGEGCTVISPDVSATQNDIKLVKKLFSAIGGCEEIPESLMESVGAVVGSGPAYVFMFIDALADGAVKYGVPRNMALRLASQMVTGASKMVLESKKHPGVLKDEVCSPGGTTICGLHELEKGNFRGTVMNAVESAVQRAKDIKSTTSKDSR